MIFAALGTCLGVGVDRAALGVMGGFDAQAQRVVKPQVPKAKPAATKPPVATKPAATKPAATKPAATKPAATKPVTKTTPAKRAPAKSKTAGEQVPVPSEKAVAARRDPFKALVWASGPTTGQPGEVPITGPLPPGARGLVISQLLLEGIVRQDLSNTMIAVVANESKRAYFLRENDTLYNGVVSKITPDAVYFKENILDPSGQVGSREVVKRMGPAPGEVK